MLTILLFLVFRLHKMFEISSKKIKKNCTIVSVLDTVARAIYRANKFTPYQTFRSKPEPFIIKIQSPGDKITTISYGGTATNLKEIINGLAESFQVRNRRIVRPRVG